MSHRFKEETMEHSRQVGSPGAVALSLHLVGHCSAVTLGTTMTLSLPILYGSVSAALVAQAFCVQEAEGPATVEQDPQYPRQ